MEQLVRFGLYFLLGGCTTLAASYINEAGKGGIAALVASLPIFFLLTAVVAYYTSGPVTAYEYSRGLIFYNIGWLIAVAVFAYCINHDYSLASAVVGTIMAYLTTSYFVRELV